MECEQCSQIKSADPATRIILITGFLGSGKTSLLKHLLSEKSEQEIKRIGVIVNEFGKVGIDGTELGSHAPLIKELNNGSIFCQCLAGTFIDSIAEMLSMNISELYIESTGLADPSNMQDILANLKKRTAMPYVNSGVVCVVDAKYFRKLSQSSAMINRQILQSSIVVINKMDLVRPVDLEELKRAINKLNPLAKIITTVNGRVDSEELAKLHRSRLGRNLTSLNTPGSRSRTFTMQPSGPILRDNLSAWLNSLQNDVFRIKGFVRLQGEPGMWLLSKTGNEVSITKAMTDTIAEEIVIIPYLDTLSEYDLHVMTDNILQVEIRWQD